MSLRCGESLRSHPSFTIFIMQNGLGHGQCSLFRSLDTWVFQVCWWTTTLNQKMCQRLITQSYGLKINNLLVPNANSLSFPTVVSWNTQPDLPKSRNERSAIIPQGRYNPYLYVGAVAIYKYISRMQAFFYMINMTTNRISLLNQRALDG